MSLIFSEKTLLLLYFKGNGGIKASFLTGISSLLRTQVGSALYQDSYDSVASAKVMDAEERVHLYTSRIIIARMSPWPGYMLLLGG